MRKLWVVALLMACATIGAGMRPAKLSLSIDVMDAPGDSVDVRLSWNAVTDGIGDPVDHYEWGFTGNGEVLATGTTTQLEVTRRFARLIGDTLRIQGHVRAVDSRGVPGAVGTSAVIPVYREIPAPAAPEVRLDTIPLAISEMDSLQAFAASDWYGPDGRIHMKVGESVQMCVIAWNDNVPFRPFPQAPECMSIEPMYHQLKLYRPLGDVQRTFTAE